VIFYKYINGSDTNNISNQYGNFNELYSNIEDLKLYFGYICETLRSFSKVKTGLACYFDFAKFLSLDGNLCDFSKDNYINSVTHSLSSHLTMKQYFTKPDRTYCWI